MSINNITQKSTQSSKSLESMKSIESLEIKQNKLHFKSFFLSLIFGPIIIYQYITLFKYYNEMNSVLLLIIGWSTMIIFPIFAQIPVWIFKKYGKTTKGKSYIYTNKLVDKGLYAILRHPQYTSWILISVAVTCLTQLWYNFILTAIVSIMIYIIIIKADKELIQKFGEKYKIYMKKVPRTNFILGVIRYIIRKIKNHKLKLKKKKNLEMIK